MNNSGMNISGIGYDDNSQKEMKTMILKAMPGIE